MSDGEVLEAVVKVHGALGLHTRPAAELAKLVSGGIATVTLARTDAPDETADGSSILSLLMLSAVDGTELKLQVSGQDRELVFNRVKDFFAAGFDSEP